MRSGRYYAALVCALVCFSAASARSAENKRRVEAREYHDAWSFAGRPVPAQAEFQHLVDDVVKGPAPRSRKPLLSAMTFSADCEVSRFCALDKATKDRYLINFVASVIEEGLDRLSNWDPRLADRILQNVEGTSDKLTCRDGQGIQHSTSLLFNSESLSFNHEINLGYGVVGWVNAMTRASSSCSDATEESRDYARAATLNDWPRRSSEHDFDRQAIFHEFLHHARMDNVPADVHRTPIGTLRKELDRVTACGALAFPTTRQYLVRSRDAIYPITARGCETCLGAGSPGLPRCRQLLPPSPEEDDIPLAPKLKAPVF